MYEKNGSNPIAVKELHLYGSGSLGYITTGTARRYAVSNHLGNVMAVVTQNRIPDNPSNPTYFNPEVTTTNDYYAFGSLIPGRHTATSAYRHGFNGKENDNELLGEGHLQDYGFRPYLPALGRFFSPDPLTQKYPELTPYQFASNRPVDGVDLDGLEWRDLKPDKNPDGTVAARPAVLEVGVAAHFERSSNLVAERKAEVKKYFAKEVRSKGETSEFVGDNMQRAGELVTYVNPPVGKTMQTVGAVFSYNGAIKQTQADVLEKSNTNVNANVLTRATYDGAEKGMQKFVDQVEIPKLVPGKYGEAINAATKLGVNLLFDEGKANELKSNDMNNSQTNSSSNSLSNQTSNSNPSKPSEFPKPKLQRTYTAND